MINNESWSFEFLHTKAIVWFIESDIILNKHMLHIKDLHMKMFGFKMW